MSTPANLSEQVLATPSGAGAVRSLGETFTPDLQTGAGRYRIPLPLLAGPAGLMPALQLSYASTGGNGRAGLGWDLDLAAVSRRTDRGLPTYDDGRDRFALQGDELVAQGGGCYRFRVDGRFARVRHLTGGGQDAWLVTERDGTRAFYGEVAEARLSDGAGRIAAWYVTRTQDVHGNEVIYSYERDPRTAEVRVVSMTWATCYRVLIEWAVRPDPIVSARTGFPTRVEHRVSSIALQVERSDTHAFHTYRRYDLQYAVSRWTGRSLLACVAATGIGPDDAERALPALAFEYVDADLSRARWLGVGGDRPGDALSSPNVTLARQSGSGLPDILETRPTGHTLRVNTGGGHFRAARPVSAPALVALADAGTFLSDMDGDGYADLVVDGGRRVYTARPTGGWGATYRSAQGPSIDLDAADVRVADLTGNGLPDALRSGVSGWIFFENLGDGRWAPGVRVLHTPPIRLDDPRVHLVDIDGDGLADLAYVDRTGVTVWPSLGRGRFGAPRRMLGDLRFGEALDPRDVRFVDLTGSGQADLLYTRDGVAHVAFNHAGVALTALVEAGRSALSSHGFVEAVDLLGAGVDGLLYTDRGGEWRFRELFTSGPLDLLSTIDNGIGGVTTIAYGTSASHWARDLAAGQPWRTAMPIAVRVVDRVTTRDVVTGNELEMSYQYAHGVYDGDEREFRGFARVTQLDREAPADDPDPIAQARVVRWYHTGADVDLRDEWFAVPGTPLDDEIPDHPWARRATRGLLRREETWALDGDRRPYLVTEAAWRAFAVGRSSSRLESAWAPLEIRKRKTVLERTSDARQSEVRTIYDLHDGRGSGYGLPIEVREIGHGRRGSFSTDHERQQTETLERVARTAYVSLDRPEPESLAGPYIPYYVVGKPSLEERFAVTGAVERLLASSRSFYDGEPYEGLGYPGSGTAPGLTHGRLSARLDLAFTAASFGETYPADSGAAAARDERGRYLVDGDRYYMHAARNAWRDNGLPSGSLDPNGHETTVEYDATWELFPVRVIDPLGHPTSLERGTLPFQVAVRVDANGNRTEFTYDPVALPRARSVMGKFVDGAWEGDPPEFPTEVYDYAFDALPIEITTRTRQVREGATFDVHRFIDGLGRTVQERRTAEADPATPSTPRVRVTGWRVYNHKGQVVRHYQPVFATGTAFSIGDDTTAVVATRYDPLGRAIRIDFPDGAFSTTAFHPWHEIDADRNDNAGHFTSDDARYGAIVESFAHHVGTPTRRFIDALGRVFATAEDNGGEAHVIREVLDLENRIVDVFDPRHLSDPTQTFRYNEAGRVIRTRHTTALGERHVLADAAGNPIWERDARGIEVRRVFDALDRPLSEHTDDGAGVKLRRQWRYVPYDEQDPSFATNQARNLFGAPEEERDADGLRFFDYDFRGLVTRTSHRFWSQQDADGRSWDDPASQLWTGRETWDPEIPSTERDEGAAYLDLTDLTDTATLVVSTRHDSAGRPIEVAWPEGVRSRPSYNAAGLLESLEIDRGEGDGFERVVEAFAYDARGQMTYVRHGNGVETVREYDPALERLTRIFTQRVSGSVVHLQDLAFALDPMGNLVEIADHLATSQFSDNRIVPNARTFGYDPRYRLIRATGKKHRTVRQKDPDVLIVSPDPNDYEPYTHVYAYDAVGNLTRNPEYAAGALHYKDGRLDLFNGDEAEAGAFGDPVAGNYRYDAAGNTTHTPRHEALAYTHDNHVRYVDLGGGGQVRYFGHGDQRVVRLVRKNGVVALGVYLGPFEYHRRRGVRSYTKLVLHVEGQGRHAQAERILAGTDADSLDRFFFHGDHLASGHVLTRDDGELLSQEEYFPYGSSSDRRDARNRYRFLGVERDEDTHLTMTGPRTYDSVIGRFLQGDPLSESAPATSPYVYADANPAGRVDPSGYQPTRQSLEVFMGLYDHFFEQGLNQATMDFDTGTYRPGTNYGFNDVTRLARQTLERPRNLGGYGIRPELSSRMLYTASDPIVGARVGTTAYRPGAGRKPFYRPFNVEPDVVKGPAPLRTPTLTPGANVPAAAAAAEPAVASVGAEVAASGEAALVRGGAAKPAIGPGLKPFLGGLATGIGIGLLGAAQHNEISHEPEFVLSFQLWTVEFWDPLAQNPPLFKWERNPNYRATGDRNNDAAGPGGVGVGESMLP